MIGYDAGPKDARRGKDARTEDENFLYRYPLREDGRHGLTKIQGLWGRDVKPTAGKPEGKLGSWRAWAERLGILRGIEIVMPTAELTALAFRMKGPSEEASCAGQI